MGRQTNDAGGDRGARGHAYLSFLQGAAEYINDLDVPTHIYHLGDHDPSGVNAGEKIEETLRRLAPDAANQAIEEHLLPDRFNILKADEESECEIIAILVDGLAS